MISEKNTKQELLEEYKRLVSEVSVVPAGAKGIGVKSTKADILNAIKLLESNKSPAPTTREVPTVEEKKTETVDVPVKAVKNSVRLSIEEEDDLKYLKSEIRDEIEALNTAKKLKKQEYSELVAIEGELVKFVNMINEYKKKNILQEESHTQQIEELNKKLAESAEKLAVSSQERLEKATALSQEADEKIIRQKEELALQRSKEEEEYRYKLTKTWKEEDDLWSDELARREEAIADVKEEIATLQADIDGKAELVAELQAKIDEIPQLIEKAMHEGEEAKEKELGKEHGYKTNMAKKDAEVAVQSLQKQIDRLKADYDAVLLEKNAIQEKLDKAYEESNKLYMQTVQSTGGVKILSNLDKN